MKKLLSSLALAAMLLSLAACGGKGDSGKQAGSDVDTLKSEYGFQWTDPSTPILDRKSVV